MAAVDDHGLEQQPSQRHKGVDEHDSQADPNDPAFATAVPVADGSGSPTPVLR